MPKVYFKSRYKICGVLNIPNVSDNRIIILCHGGGASSKESSTNVDLEKEFQKIGISTFRFDFTGHGESEGKPEDFTIQQGIEDIFSAMNFLRTKGYKDFILLGTSRGGACALRAAVKSKNLKCLVLISPTSKYEHFDERPLIAKRCNVPTLIIQGDMDKSVPVERSRKLCDMMPICSLKIVKGADHGYTLPEKHRQRIFLAIQFIQKYL